MSKTYFLLSTLLFSTTSCAALEKGAADPTPSTQSSNVPLSVDKAYAKSAAEWYENVYAVSFVEGDENFFDYYPDQTYAALGNDPGFFDKTALSTKIDQYIKPWVEAGWSKTELHSVAAEPISTDAALITARWRILNDDGENVTECALPAWRYVIVGSGDNRRIIAEFEAPCADE